jgi:CRISPR/Cas system-associated exonuclease Cas4 (RecB family)
MLKKENKNTYRYYPSSAAFSWGDLTFTRYSSGCVRNIFFRNLIPIPKRREDEISERKKEIGAEGEDYYLDTYRTGEEVVRENAIQLEEGGLTLSGKVDVLGDSWVAEVKSTESHSLKREVIRKGGVLDTHVAQLVTYMDMLQVSKGYLFVVFFNSTKKRPEPTITEEREFVVDVDFDTGFILIDQKSYQFKLEDLRQHRKNVDRSLRNMELPPRPFHGEIKFTGACHFCRFKTLCSKIEAHEDVGDLTDENVLEKLKIINRKEET